jgi:tetratricopeptide (TPR) repeat protein
MPKLWFTVSTLSVLLAVISACHPPQPTCEPGDPSCEDGPPQEPKLSEEEAEARLEQINARYVAAAADGLDPAECKELTASYQKLYEGNPEQLVARFNVGALHEACGDPDQAEAIYVELADRHEYAPALNNLGVLAWSRGDHEGAFALFGRAVEADQLHAIEARNNLAMALRERYTNKASLADFEEAEGQLKNILAVDSANKAAYENLARLYYDRGRQQDKSYLVLADLVVTQAQRVLEAHGEASGDLHNLRGLILMEDGDQVRALRAFQRAVEVEPDHPDANRNIAMIAIRFRDYATAERSLESVIELDVVAADTDAWIALGVAKRGLRKFDEAEAAYRAALELDPGDPRPWFNLGVLAQDHLSGPVEGEALIAVYEEALGHYQTFVDRAGTTKRWHTEVVEAKDRIAVVEDSIETIEKMKELEEMYEELMRKEEEQRLARIEELKALEAKGVSIDELQEP